MTLSGLESNPFRMFVDFPRVEMTAGSSENCVHWSGLLRLQWEMTLADVEIIA